jgi:hypothetical protein
LKPLSKARRNKTRIVTPASVIGKRTAVAALDTNFASLSGTIAEVCAARQLIP